MVYFGDGGGNCTRAPPIGIDPGSARTFCGENQGESAIKAGSGCRMGHKSKAYRSILDLSFQLRLKNGGFRDALNDTTVKTAPGGAIDQLGECLSQIIHAFAAAEEAAKIFMAKWDIKDRFWRMDCREGEEWNFAYVLPQPEGEPIRLVIPTSGDSYIFTNGMGRVTSVFLRGYRDGTGYRNDLH